MFLFLTETFAASMEFQEFDAKQIESKRKYFPQIAIYLVNKLASGETSITEDL